MKCDIILAGVGGQGILSIAASIGLAAMEEGLFLKQAEVHGMSQRGGAVHSSLRLSSREIASDLIPEGQADLIISVEPMESLRYLPFLSPDGWVLTNSNPVINIPDYPETGLLLDEVTRLKKHVLIDADAAARKLGYPKASNMIMLGASVPFIGIPGTSFEAAVSRLFSSKGEKVVSVNLAALAKGMELAEQKMKQLS